MEVYQELRHACKFCGKSFPCGRSLGGHMRSHLNNTGESTNKIRKKKLASFSNDDKEAAAQNGYSLREKPKKTNKFAISSDDDDHDDINKSCRECGKKFTTWKALFGHMKSHSDKVSVSIEDDDSLNSCDQKLVLDSQSDNEAAAPIRKQRRSRTTKRYKNIAVTNTDFQVNNGSSCVSEIEQEQEEVALSLILLSRDVTVHCGGWKSTKGDYYSSEINSAARISAATVSDSKSEIKNLDSSGSEFTKSKTVKTARLDLISLDSDSLKSKLKQTEDKRSSISRNGIGETEIIPEVQGNGILGDDLIEKAKTEQENEIQPQGIEVGLPEVKSSELEIKKPKSNKRKRNKMHDPEKLMDSSMNLCYGKSDSSFHFADSNTKSKFECTSCNKIFHSYQALGGHRAGHKKMKGCLGSKIESSENSTETEISPNQTADSKTIINNEKIPTEISAENIRISEHGTKKSSEKVHACPICFKTFPSGQALGGHKRSHLIAEAKSNKQQQSEATTTADSSKAVENKIKIPEIRDFLDLNMPAPEDELAENNEREYYNPWWIGSNQKQEQLVELML